MKRQSSRWNPKHIQQAVLRSPARAMLLAIVLAGAGAIAIHLSSASTPPEEGPAAPSAATAAEVAPEQIVVKYKPSTTEGQTEAVAESVGANEKDQIPQLRVKVLKVPKEKRAEIIEKLKADPRVEYAEPDGISTNTLTKPNDTEYSKQAVWPRTMTDILWDKSKGSSSVIIAILDSGINTTHPDLSGKIVGAANLWDNNNDATDILGHGTAGASVAAASTNNSLGVAGGCWECRIMPLKIEDAAGSSNSTVIAKAITHAADNGAKVINLSLNQSGAFQVVSDAIDYALGKGAITVASAGNDGTSEAKYPGAFPNAISVTATTMDDKLTSYANFSSVVDIAALGKHRVAAHDSTGYKDIEGTSFSAPAVAGIIGNLWSAFPTATPAQIRSAIISTADSCCDGKISGGRINAARAMAYLEGGGTVADTTKPAVDVITPADGAMVGGKPYHITGRSTDNVLVSKVELQINDSTPFATGFPNFDLTWDTSSLANGTQFAVKLTAFDSSGNASATVTRNVTINNGGTTPPPTTPPPTTPPPTTPPPGGNPKSPDINGSGKVDLTDLSILLSNWNKNTANADLNSNGKVDLTDLSMLLSKWNTAG